MLRLRLVARFGGKGQLSRFVLGSVMGHGLFVAGLVLVPTLTARRHRPDSPLVVDLVAPAFASAPSAPSPTVPAPKAEPEDGLRSESQKPAPPPPLPKRVPEKPKKPPEKKVAQPPQPRPDPAPPSETPPAEAQPAAATGAVGGPREGTGSSITPLGGTLGDEFDWYRALVAAALHAQWRKPVLDERVGAIEVAVTCEIQRDGSVRDLKVTRPSGVLSLDRSAQRAVMDAAPLPPLPRTWSESSLSAGFVFQLSAE